MRITVAVAAAFLVATSLASGQERSTPKQTVLALSKQDHTVSIIDPSIMKIVATVPVGDDPHEIVASSDGRTAYVSNYGFGRFHSLAVIDLIAQKQLPFIELGALKGPHGLDFVDGKVWFTAEAAKAIGSRSHSPPAIRAPCPRAALDCSLRSCSDDTGRVAGSV